MITVALVVASLTSSASVESASVENAGYGYVTGNYIAEQCATEKSDPIYFPNHAFCTGFILGVADSFTCASPRFGTGWRAQERILAGQLVKVVVAYLGMHPEALHKDAGSLVASALGEAFPCY